MIKNYLPFVIFESKLYIILGSAQKKKGSATQVVVKKQNIKKAPSKLPQAEQPKTYEDRRENQIE